MPSTPVISRLVIRPIAFVALAWATWHSPAGPSPAHAQPAPPSSPGYHLWLGAVDLGEVPPPSTGLHRGPAVSFGGRSCVPTWNNQPAAPGPYRRSRPLCLFSHQESSTGSPPPDSAPQARKELVILTTDALATASTVLQGFMSFREAEGWNVVLATEADWDVPLTSGDDGRQERIRAYLAQRYSDDPGAFLLLIGDPDPYGDGVPMKMVHPFKEWASYYDDWLAELLDPIPTDFYYADLDGDWDCDGDGDYGEYPDDDGSGCVDFGPELYVGRIPVYDGDHVAMDTVLQRTLDRDTESDKSYRANQLFPGALLAVEGAPSPTGGAYDYDDDGASVLATIYRDMPQYIQDGSTRLFEDEGLLTSPYQHEDSLSYGQVIQYWNEGRGIVVWCGHGSVNGAFRTIWSQDGDGDGLASSSECDYPSFMDSDGASDLESAPGAFTFHVSCENGFPEQADNLGTSLLYGGAAATATASRLAFAVTVDFGATWEPRPDIATSTTVGYYFTQELLAGSTAGEALAYTKYALSGDAYYPEVTWTTRVEYNLYGDPTRSLEFCESDSQCDDGSPCTGTESCQDGFCVHHDPVDCSYLDAQCTVGTCETATGECISQPALDGVACDDGLWCSEYDSCTDGICYGQDRDCGSRDGYVSYCDEASESCFFTQLTEEPTGLLCGTSPPAQKTPWYLLALLACLPPWRRRAGHES